ncbi:MAG TPA: 4Fe-4S binding protein [bacterium]|nr:4Fe-4S binding protein [bacterium]HOH07409.1 4Fe-4S binding protein [bacterium]HOY44398.1 4Fe-4S binding protein [bacterium]HPM60114.1 4Fe-4S binding protein [bacterium]
MAEETLRRKREAEITINTAWCKGCVICVELCPEQVLVMERGKAKVAHLDKCTVCGLCELRCPDFAIVVVDKNKSPKTGE